MKVIEHLERAKEPLISFEIIPPLRGGDFKSMMALIEDLAEHKPPFIDITSHPAVENFVETPDGYRRVVKRKRPGTLGVCALIQNKYNIEAVPHVLCKGFTREETEDFLIELRFLGINNIFAVRGDDTGYEKPLGIGRSANRYASDLIGQIAGMNRGSYLDTLLNADPTDFCIGASGYPEKHFEAPNLTTDVRMVKKKVEAGAEYIVTQMFFDNQYYFEFVDLCRAEGIDVPIIPGLKVLSSMKQLSSIPRTFHCEIPQSLAEEASKMKDNEGVRNVGVEWATQQTQQLLDKGVRSVHFYVMQSAKSVSAVIEKLKK